MAGGTSVQSHAFAGMLLMSDLVTREQLALARAAKARTGAHIDETLIHLGMLDEARLLDLMVFDWELDRANLRLVDDSLVRQFSGQDLIAANWLPLYRLPSGATVVATARVPDEERTREIETALGTPAVFAVATSWEIKRAILRIFAPEIANQAADDLWRQNPRLSARVVFSRAQKVGIALGLALLLVALILWTTGTVAAILGVASFIFLAGTAFKFFISLRGAKYDVVERVTDAEVGRLNDEDLPRYTVLVPVFKEANIVAQLVDNLGGLDWPTEKLEILILVEEEDTETRDAFAAANAPDHFHVITVPKGHPQTKPRACNVGLFFATGDYLVIYDAEDTPDPDQLKKAFIAFRRGGDHTVCVQASLNFFNADENVLTRMFTLEYSYWFDYMLAGLDAHDLPIPLGGTSNHFRTTALIELGGWDPYNVTEDADLGIRASALGYRVGVINSTTMEEANTSVPNFIRQRSRWIKGYMQTTLVHARSPIRLIASIGVKRFLSFVLLIAGTPATFLAVLPFYIVTAVTFLAPTEFISSFFPVWVLWVSLANFVLGNAIIVYLSMMGPFKRGAFGLILWALLNPLYWLLHSIAAYKGLWQLLTRPHYWEKTDHGLTNQYH
ncbi:MAG: glycosyltransferase [Salinibacterium sp.]|nr:glycosyltransferase [Salinibacterium sp.]